MDKAFKLELLAKAAKRELAKKSFLDFVPLVDKDYQMNWHHRLICQKLDLWVERKIKRLMIFAPPRHGKSELVSRKLPAYILGKYPDSKIIACSYGADLASMMSRDVQRIMESKAYKELFSDIKLGQKGYLKKNDFFEVVCKKGFYRGTGVGGGITGMGGDYLILDDPIKNRLQANSLVHKEGVWDWYTSTLYTRLEKDGCILLTLTRWHEDDLAGRLLKQMENDGAEKWEVLKFCALAENDEEGRRAGDALWEDRFSKATLQNIKSTIGSYDFNALYQQRPQDYSGGIFKRHWWQYWEELPYDLEDYIQSWDCAFKATDSSDYVVGQVWARKGARRYLLYQLREKMTFSQTLKAIKEVSLKFPKTYRKLVEDKANGTAVIDALKNEISGLISVNPLGGKVVRANAVTPCVEAGNVFLPKASHFPWVLDFVEELSLFPNGANDDQVDAMSQANAYYNGRGFNFKGLIS